MITIAEYLLLALSMFVVLFFIAFAWHEAENKMPLEEEKP